MHVAQRRIVFALCALALVASSREVQAQDNAPGSADPAEVDQVASQIEQRLVELGEKDESLLELIAKRSLRRFRRGMVLGPFVTLAPGYSVDNSEADFQASAGLGIMRFDIPPIPSMKRLIEIAQGHATKVLKERIRAALLRGESLTDADLDRLARETIEDMKAEIFLTLRPRRFERPSLALRAEAGYFFSAEAVDLRTIASLGIGPVFVSTGTVVQLGDDTLFIVPLEISLPMTLSKGLRSPVIDFFIRGDFTVNKRETAADRFLLGARFMLDVL